MRDEPLALVDWLEAFCIVVLGILWWQLVGYPFVMALASTSRVRQGNRASRAESENVGISVIVPTFNEATVVARRIRNLSEQAYPQDLFEIIIVDSGSSDGTAEAAAAVIPSNARILHESERHGKASAVNSAFDISKYEILLVTDANTEFSPNVLSDVACCFRDPDVAVVGGRFVPIEPPGQIGSSMYWNLECAMRLGEASFDSACLVHGEVMAWRKALGSLDPAVISEDLELCIRARRSGKRIAYAPNALASEPIPLSRKELTTQRRRTAVGTIQVLRKYRSYWLPPHDRYSAIILWSHKVLPLLFPFLLLFLGAVALSIILFGGASGLIFILLSLVLATLLSGATYAVTLRLVRRRIALPHGTAPATAVLGIPAFLGVLAYSVLESWRDYFTGHYTVLWKKAETARR